MFGIGFNELLIILIVVLVFVRPKDLPGLARRLGRIVGGLRSGYDRFVRDIDEHRPVSRQTEDSAVPENTDGTDDEKRKKQSP